MSRSPRRFVPQVRAWIWPLTAALALGLTVSTPASSAPDDDALRQQLTNILADPRLDGAVADVIVADANTGERIFEHSPNTRLMPASNTKLPTSTAAVELLGADYRWSTDVLAAGDRNGTALRGDLYLRGTGDPTMLAADYDALAAQVAAAGITQVTGGVVADDTRFDSNRLGNSWAADDEYSYYSAQISALTLAPDTDYDSGTVIVEAFPGAKAGDKPVVKVTPPNSYVKIDVRGTTVAAGQRDTLGISREHGNNTVVIDGDIPVGASATKEWIAVWEPTGYAAAVFRDALEAHGVRVLGGTRLGVAAPADAEPVATHDSMTLGQLLIPFLKLSNNMHAEMLVKTIGYEKSGAGTWSAGLSRISAYLSSLGVNTAQLRQVDGSGLSRMNNISGEAFVKLLTKVRAEPWFQEWYDALPIACVPDRFTGGTLRSRMCGTKAAGNVRGKTGSLTGASSLSGYVTDADGRELVFTVQLNNYMASSVKDIEDKVGVALASYSAESAPATLTTGPSATRSTAPAADLECSWQKPRMC
ncbi:D-alanyl-D-alanine carboxypeptidase DacC [Streptomyces sp. RB5]|uniref:D-alanyl-D-alanine carboxypeptidase DacC n=1 Tax=Streptomyces smaragdinus TaxID=2585196 RepID=A0A7K0CJF8_9ACTN|nr:D-alanyl-D-alanine carboxypeptidase/D-alanyl-D-alanine-endopeptidase [Streptomyces smaragdinus]MQY13541.1 D-alanyl-D-alanine carboxypeptidase DacC [Streptomyces smaragdinus]